MLIPKHTVVEAPQRYQDRQATIAAQATGPHDIARTIRYTSEEHQTWEQMQAMLAPLWERHVAMPLRTAQLALDLPKTRIPQLSLVSDRLHMLTGFRYASVAGTVPGQDFFAALADRVFSSTQFIRWSGNLGYTPEPDVVHEVGGHAVSLADPRLAELHRLAGLASLAMPHILPAIAAVFWYSIEFGVVAEADGWKAYGTGLLSSPGELAWFSDNARIEPLSIAAMISTPYDISHFQPTLFGASSLDEVFDVVGSFYRDVVETGSSPRRQLRTSQS